MKIVKLTIMAIVLSLVATLLFTGCSVYAKTFKNTVWEIKEGGGDKYPLATNEGEKHIYIAFDADGQFYSLEFCLGQDGKIVESTIKRMQAPYKVSKSTIKVYDHFYNYSVSGDALILDYPYLSSKYQKVTKTLEEIKAHF